MPITLLLSLPPQSSTVVTLSLLTTTIPYCRKFSHSSSLSLYLHGGHVDCPSEFKDVMPKHP